MNKSILKIFICCTAFFFCTQVMAQAPNTFVWNGKTLKSNKARINNHDAELTPAYKQLIKDADKAMKEGPFSVMEKKNDPPSGDKHDYMSLAPYFWPDPSKPNGLPYMRKDGETNPEVKDYKDKEYMPNLCELVNTLALSFYFSGDEMYAAHAADLLRVWFLNPATKMNPNLNFSQAIKGQNDGRGAGLIDSRHFIKLIDGINLLQDSKNWKKDDQQGMQQWFAQFLNWMQTSRNGVSELNAENNHGTWYDAQRLSMALFIDSTDLAKKIVMNAERRLDQQMDEEGKFPREMERTIALHYNLFDLEAFFLIASMAEHLNMDLWNYNSPSGKSLKKGFDFLYPYISKQKEWTGQQIKDFEFEEAYPVLMQASPRFKCKDCKSYIKKLAADKADHLRIYLVSE